MFGSVTSTLRFIIGAVLLLNVLHRYETFRITRSPDKTTVVIEGVNSTNVALYWMFSLKVNESIRNVAFNRRRFSESDTRIAIKRGNQPFTYDSDEFKANYVARSSPISATLVLVNVINSEEYTYTLRLTYADGNGKILSRPTSSTSVVVYVPPNLTLNPFRKAYVEVGQNYTLTCKASGDPLPVITWTRDGVPRDQFNVSGYELHLANVHTKDVGSYRCTAHNGYGEDSSTVGIIGLNCDAGSQCRSEKVNITLSSETWNENLSNNESSEFKALEKELLSEILEVYARNYGKQLYRLTVEKFSPGSVVATMRFSFGLSACEPLKPLQDEIAGAKLGQFTVDRQLYVFPQILIPATTPSTTNAMTQTKTPASVNADADNKEQTLMLHAIYLAAIGFLVLVNIILMILLWRWRKSSGSAKERGCRCRNRENNNQLKDVQGERPAVEGCAADAISDNTELASLPSLLPSDPSLDGAQQSIYDACEVVTTSKKNWESGREYVNLVKDIGKGAFCKVAKAEAWNINGIKGLTTVAVKMLKENASESDRKDLLSELELMKNLRPHPHVIKLMGCVTKSDPLLVLIEYIPYGDLLGFLRKSRGLNDTYYKDPDVKPRTNLTSRQMIQFAWQIADGMSYLSSKKIIHRDLAARNVLVGEGEMCKVTDFGMARNVQEDDIYTKRSRGRLPVKWTAYEALLYGKYTTQSDVWSFGVVLYEIFTVGGCPYPGINGREIANRLKSGYRMPKPKHVDRQLYQTMLQCWQQNPNDRPTFFALKNKLTSMVENNEEIYINMQEYDTKDYGYIDDLLE